VPKTGKDQMGMHILRPILVLPSQLTNQLTDEGQQEPVNKVNKLNLH